MNKKVFRKKPAIFAIVVIVAMAIGVFLMVNAQNYSIKADYATESVKFVNNVATSMQKREQDLNTLDQYNKDVSADLIYNITYIYDGIDFPNLNWKLRESLNPTKLCDMEEYNLESLNIIGEDGTIWISDDDDLLKKNIVEEGIISQNDLDFFNEDGYGTYKIKYDEDGNRYSSNEPVTGMANGYKVRFYAVKVFGKNPDELYYAVGADRNDVEEDIARAYSDLGAYFDPIVDYDGFSAFAVNTDTGIIEYTSPSNKDLQGRLISDVGIENINSLDDGEFHKTKLNGSKRTIYVKCEDIGMLGKYALVATDIEATGVTGAATIVSIILILGVTLLLIRAGYKLALSHRKHLAQEYIACVIACVILSAIVAVYASTVGAISEAMTQCEVNGEAFAKYYKAGIQNTEKMSEFYQTKKVSVLKSIAIYLQQNEKALMDETDAEIYEYYERDEDGKKEYIRDANGNICRSIANNAELQDIAEDESYSELYVINSMGNTILTSCDNWYFTINDDKSGYDQEFNNVLERKSKDFYKYQTGDDNIGRELVAVPYELYVSSDGQGHKQYHDFQEYKKDTTGKINLEYGLLVAKSKSTEDLRLNMESIPREILSSMKAAEGVELIVTEKVDDARVYKLCTDGIREEDFTEMDIPESYYLSNNYKYLNLNDIYRMLGIVCLNGLKEMNLITVLDNKDIQSQRWPVVIATVVAVMLIGIVLIVYFTKFFEEEEKQEHISGEETEDDRDNKKQYAWIKNLILSIGAFVLLAFILYILLNTDANLRFIRYVISVKWVKGVHIFSLSYLLFLLLTVTIVISLAREFVHLLAPVLNGGAETVLRLLLSLVQYGCIIASIFFALYLFGFQMGTVVTSAGIMTIVIGLGANSLIGDIIAGLFIIFEHEYQVGNYITVGDTTGVVREIGLRTTKIENASGNIKIINNSSIKEVLNLTDNLTAAVISVSISNDIPVKKIDKLVKTRLKEKVSYCKEIHGSPIPGGILEKPIGTNGYYLYSVAVRCEQKDVTLVKRALFAEFIEMLGEENIPFI